MPRAPIAVPNQPTSLPGDASLRDADWPPRITGNNLPTIGINEQVEILHRNRTQKNLVPEHDAPNIAFPISDLYADRPDIGRLRLAPVGKRHPPESLKRQFELPRDRFRKTKMQRTGIHQRRSMHRRDIGSRIAENQIDVHKPHVSTPNAQIVEPEQYAYGDPIRYRQSSAGPLNRVRHPSLDTGCAASVKTPAHQQTGFLLAHRNSGVKAR